MKGGKIRMTHVEVKNGNVEGALKRFNFRTKAKNEFDAERKSNNRY